MFCSMNFWERGKKSCLAFEFEVLYLDQRFLWLKVCAGKRAAREFNVWMVVFVVVFSLHSPPPQFANTLQNWTSFWWHEVMRHTPQGGVGNYWAIKEECCTISQMLRRLGRKTTPIFHCMGVAGLGWETTAHWRRASLCKASRECWLQQTKTLDVSHHSREILKLHYGM